MYPISGGTLVVLFAFLLASCGGGDGGQPAPTLNPIAVASLGAGGGPASGNSQVCDSCMTVSANGRFVVFDSTASDIVMNDTNNAFDVFLRDFETGTTTRVSVPNLGVPSQSAGASLRPSISANGRYVVFQSNSQNLVTGDSNNQQDVFLHDTQTGETVRVSVPSVGLGGQSNGISLSACVSDDGRYVGFQSAATNLVAGDNNNLLDVFVHDRTTGVTERVSIHTNGAEANSVSTNCSISADGMIVTFQSRATNLVDADTNGKEDIFVRNRNTNETARVSVDSTGNEGDGAFDNTGFAHLSADGRYVVFLSAFTNLVASDTTNASDVFVHDRTTGTTTRVSLPNLADQGALGVEADNASRNPSISQDGRYVAFTSFASNLVQGDLNTIWDVFVHDTQTGATARVNVSATGDEMTTGEIPNTSSARISGDGRYIVFGGSPVGGVDPNIVSSDTNAFDDVYRAPNPLWQ